MYQKIWFIKNIIIYCVLVLLFFVVMGSIEATAYSCTVGASNGVCAEPGYCPSGSTEGTSNDCIVSGDICCYFLPDATPLCSGPLGEIGACTSNCSDSSYGGDPLCADLNLTCCYTEITAPVGTSCSDSFGNTGGTCQTVAGCELISGDLRDSSSCTTSGESCCFVPVDPNPTTDPVTTTDPITGVITNTTTDPNTGVITTTTTDPATGITTTTTTDPATGSVTTTTSNTVSPPAGGAGGIVPCGGGWDDPCDFGSFMTLIESFIKYVLLWIIIPLAAIIFMYAGYLMMTAAGNEAKLTQAKKAFWYVLIGLLVALAAWLIVEGLMKGLGLKDEFWLLDQR